LGNTIYICMHIHYKTNKLQKQLTVPKETQKAFGTMAKKVVQRMSEMQDADNLAVLMSIPAAYCHPLKGNRYGEWSVLISGNFRIIFELPQEPLPTIDDGGINTILITEVLINEVTDYH
jgi:plasmid maintenance system killer protein